MILRAARTIRKLMILQRQYIKALVENGATNVEYKEIYGEGHNILKSAANTSGLLDWLFAKEFNRQ